MYIPQTLLEHGFEERLKSFLENRERDWTLNVAKGRSGRQEVSVLGARSFPVAIFFRQGTSFFLMYPAWLHDRQVDEEIDPKTDVDAWMDA